MIRSALPGVACFLVIGAVVSFVAGAVCANTSSAPLRVTSWEFGSIAWPDGSPEGWPSGAETVVVWRSSLRTQRRYTHYTAATSASQVEPFRTTVMVVDDTGAPFRSARRVLLEADGKAVEAVGALRTLSPGLAFKVIKREVVLPLRIAPVGFVLNALVYAGALRLAWWLPVLVRRRVRRRRTVCVHCGYAVWGGVCSECGERAERSVDGFLFACRGFRIASTSLILSGLVASVAWWVGGGPLDARPWSGPAGYRYASGIGLTDLWEVDLAREAIVPGPLPPIGYVWSSVPRRPEPLAPVGEVLKDCVEVASPFGSTIPAQLDVFRRESAVQMAWVWVVFDAAVVLLGLACAVLVMMMIWSVRAEARGS